MRRFKGTKGKWKYSKIMNFSDTLVSFIATEEKEIAQLRGCVNGDEIEAEANAKLIAAAPEMLNFIIEMAERYPNSEWIYKEANELIKKATE